MYYVKMTKFVRDRMYRTRDDFIVDTFCTGGPGGQKQNSNQMGVRITDKITGISAEGREFRSQLQNRSAAFKRLVDKMVDHYDTMEAEFIIDLQFNDEEHVIRTYNEKRNTVKDHRTGVINSYKDTLNGDLEKFIDGRYD